MRPQAWEGARSPGSRTRQEDLPPEPLEGSRPCDTLIPAQGTDFGLRSLGLGENTFLWFNGPACSHLLWHTGQGPSGPRTPRTTNALARAPAAPLAAGTGGPERQTSAWVQEPLCGHGSCEQGQVPARRV